MRISLSPTAIRLKVVSTLAVGLLLAHPWPAPAQTTSGTVFGKVLEKDGTGIAGAKVTIVNEEDENRRAVLTDDTGYYSRPYLPAGKYTLIGHKDGYVDRIIKSFPVQFNQKNEVRFPELTLLKVTLHGAVVDRLQNALAGATIMVAKQGSALVRFAQTDRLGEYGIDDLPTGLYVITASSSDGPGEGAQSLPVELGEEHVRASTITLEGVGPEPGPAAQILTPAATPAQGEKIAGLAHTADVSRTGNFVDLQLHSLPVGASSTMRSFDELAFLLAGVAPPPFTPGVRGPGVGFGIGTAGQFSVNGSRARSNTFSVDGSDNNDPDVGVRRQGFVALVPQSLESIREVSISTLLWDAELGRNMGGQVNAVSNYGGKGFHGQAYAYLADSRLSARNFFDYLDGKDPFTRTQLGFVFGGPIVSSRTHFFGSFEHDQTRASTEQHFAVPRQDERSFLGGQSFLVPPAPDAEPIRYKRATPLGRAILSLYPQPNNAGGPYGDNTFTQTLPFDGEGSLASFRITQRAPLSGQFNARYNFADDRRDLPSVNGAINSTLVARTRSHNLSLIYDSELSNRLFNLARFSFGRTRLELSEHSDTRFVFTGDTADALTGPIGELAIEPFSPVGVDTFYFPQERSSNTFQFADTISWPVREHSIKFGGDIRRYQLNSNLDRLYRPQVVFGSGLLVFGKLKPANNGQDEFIQKGPPVTMSGVELASLGLASSILQTVTRGVPDSTIGLRFTEYHLFFNDNWRVHPGFTIDCGLRWEHSTVPHDVNNRIEDNLALTDLPEAGKSRFDSADRTNRFLAAVAAYRLVLGGRAGIYDPDYNDFGPHVGLAWAPGTNEKTSVRAGYGIYYDAVVGAVVSQSRNVFPREIPLNIDPSVLGFNGRTLNNPAFVQIAVIPGTNPPVFTNPVDLLRKDPCNRFGACNQFGGTADDFVALIGQLFIQQGGGLAFTLPDKRLRTPYGQQWHVTVERELFGDYLFSAAYVGTRGTKLTRLTTPNLGPYPTTAVFLVNRDARGKLPAPQVLAGSARVARPEPNLGPYQIFENSANSTYHALQLEARKRYGRGYLFTAAYTWSHAMDDVSDVFPISGAPVIAQDSTNLRAERASANFDVRHRVTLSLIWDLPFFRNGKAGAARVLGGWQLSSIFQAHTGQPFTLNVPVDANLDGNLSDRSSTTDGLIFFSGHRREKVAVEEGKSVNDFFDLTRDGAVGRNTARGDGLVTLDLALTKRFSFTERQNLEWRTEFFNLFNRSNFGLPVRVIGAPGFGSATQTVTPARVIQFAVKYTF